MKTKDDVMNLDLADRIRLAEQNGDFSMANRLRQQQKAAENVTRVNAQRLSLDKQPKNGPEQKNETFSDAEYARKLQRGDPELENHVFCYTCKCHDLVKIVRDGSGAAEMFLWCAVFGIGFWASSGGFLSIFILIAFVMLAVAYTFWRWGHAKRYCRHCNSVAVTPVLGPIGKQKCMETLARSD